MEQSGQYQSINQSFIICSWLVPAQYHCNNHSNFLGELASSVRKVRASEKPKHPQNQQGGKLSVLEFLIGVIAHGTTD